MIQDYTVRPGKKGDYWYIDHKARGVRILLVAVVATLAILGSSCGSTSSMMVEDQVAARSTSGLVGSLLSTTTTVVTNTVSSLKWFIDCSVVDASLLLCPFVTSNENNCLGIASSKAFDKVEVYYSDRTKDSYSVYTTSLKVKLRSGKTLDGFMVRLKADGSKWFFDNGKWFIDADSARWYGDVDSAATTY